MGVTLERHPIIAACRSLFAPKPIAWSFVLSQPQYFLLHHVYSQIDESNWCYRQTFVLVSTGFLNSQPFGVLKKVINRSRIQPITRKQLVLHYRPIPVLPTAHTQNLTHPVGLFFMLLVVAGSCSLTFQIV